MRRPYRSRLLWLGLVGTLAMIGLENAHLPLGRAQEAPTPTPLTLPVATDVRLRPGPDADLVAANCTLCHTLKPIVTHDGFTPEQWAAEVEKMREEYGSPVDEATAARITAYLQAYYSNPPPSAADFLLGVAASPTAAPTAGPPPAVPTAHPVTINAGTCAQPVAQPAFQVGNTVPWGLDETAANQVVGGPVLTVEQTIKTTLDDLTRAGQPYSMLVHQSPESFGTYVACGAVQGNVVAGKLVIELRPIGDSGFAGIAILDKDETGFLGLGEQEVRVTVYLLAGLGAAPAGAAPTDAQATATAVAPTATPAESAAAACPAGTAGPCATIALRDVYFAPNLVTIPTDTPVTVVLPNQGAILHNFSVTDHGNPGLPNLNISVDVPPGETKTVTVNAPAGTYYFFCDQPGHEQAGMRGYLEVKEGAAISIAEETVTPRAG